MFPCDNKTFLIAVRITCDIQTLHFKNRQGKLKLSKSESRKSVWPNTFIHRLDIQDSETSISTR